MEERNAKTLRCKDARKKEEERNAKTQRCKDARKKEEETNAKVQTVHSLTAWDKLVIASRVGRNSCAMKPLNPVSAMALAIGG